MQGRGTIRVSLASIGDSCQIAIGDSGPGIPVEIREKIFTPFFTTKARGSGLGLVTAKRLVEAHHGSISVDCPPGGGTTVTVLLPGQAPRELSDGPPADAGADERRLGPILENANGGSSRS